MKKLLCILFSFVILLLFGCDKKGEISFCEEVDGIGNAKNCGAVFTPGEINIRVTSPSSFGVEKINIKVYEREQRNSNPVQEMEYKVDPAGTSKDLKFVFYNEGELTVVCEKITGEVIAEGAVKILEEL